LIGETRNVTPVVPKGVISMVHQRFADSQSVLSDLVEVCLPGTTNPTLIKRDSAT
jgi:hypothetical protein